MKYLISIFIFIINISFSINVIITNFTFYSNENLITTDSNCFLKSGIPNRQGTVVLYHFNESGTIVSDYSGSGNY